MGPENTQTVDGTEAIETKQPIYVGTKQFDSQEDLIKYTESLSNKLVQNELERPLPAQVEANKPKPSQLLFEDPDAFFELAVQEAERRVDTKLTSKDNEKQIWDKFWTDNKDLREHEDLVKAQVRYKQDEYKNLPAAQGLSKIASEVRNTVSKIKGSVQGGKELSSSPAVVAGGSNGVATTPVSKTVSASFVDQIRQRQKRGKS